MKTFFGSTNSLSFTDTSKCDKDKTKIYAEFLDRFSAGRNLLTVVN
jgi:hypothetical protein